jgi:hypothetical protein
VCDLFDNCPHTPNPAQAEPAAFIDTIFPQGPDSFGWLSPANVSWVIGDLNDVGTYGWFAQDTAATATSIGASETPPVGAAYYWLFAPDCPVGSWTSGGPSECAGESACPAGGREASLPAP